MGNRGLLAVIIVLLIGILSIVIIEASEQEPGEGIAQAIGQISSNTGNNISNN